MAPEQAKLSWKAAEKSLTEADKKRLACSFLHADHTKVNYQAAADDFGAASAASFRVMLNAALKKIREATAAAESEDGVVGSDKSTPKKNTPKKRQNEDDDADTPKKKGRTAKHKAISPIHEVEDDDDSGNFIKDEIDGEDV